MEECFVNKIVQCCGKDWEDEIDFYLQFSILMQVGLAVGDVDRLQQIAQEKEIELQVSKLHTNGAFELAKS